MREEEALAEAPVLHGWALGAVGSPHERMCFLPSPSSSKQHAWESGGQDLYPGSCADIRAQDASLSPGLQVRSHPPPKPPNWRE